METESDDLYRGWQPVAKPKKKRTGATPARRFAVETNTIVRTRKAFAHEVLESRLERSKLSKEDTAFAQVLVLGVAATWGTLDEIIDRALDNPKDIEPLVREYGDCARLCAVCDINGKRARFPGEYLHVDLPATRILIRCSGIISLTW